MNREETRKAAETMLAFADGAVIKAKPKGFCNWVADISPQWNWQECDYRTKPKPREWWVCWNGKTPESNATRHFPFPKYSEDTVDNWDNYIKVREIESE